MFCLLSWFLIRFFSKNVQKRHVYKFSSPKAYFSDPLTAIGLTFLEMKVGLTASTFDLLHAGHIAMLREAKSQCDYLIVGLQVDPSIDRRLKNTPVQLTLTKALFQFVNVLSNFRRGDSSKQKLAVKLSGRLNQFRVSNT